MKCNELLVDDTGERHRVEALHDEVINLLVILTEDFLSEVKIGSHLAAFVIPPEHDDRLWEINLEREEEHEHLNGEATSIDIVSKEEISSM